MEGVAMSNRKSYTNGSIVRTSISFARMFVYTRISYVSVYIYYIHIYIIEYIHIYIYIYICTHDV